MIHTKLTGKAVLWTVCLLFISVSAIAQNSSFMDGYIVTNDNDTIRGEIALRTDRVNGNECHFRRSPGEAAKVYYPGSIVAYRFTPGKYYVSRMVTIEEAPRNVFLEYLIEGGLALYYYRTELYTYYFLEGPDKTLMAMDNKKVERWIDTPTSAKKYEGVNQNYKGLTASVMRDWVDAQKRASDLKLNHKDMMKIVADYNNAVCADDSCIVYWSNNPTPLKISYAIFAGNISGFPLYTLVDDSKNSAGGYQVGMQFLFNSPRFSKALSLLAEVNYTHIASDRSLGVEDKKVDIETSSHGIDLRLLGRYSIGSARIRPFAEAGFLMSFNLSGKSTVTYDGRSEDIDRDADISNGVCPVLGAGLLCRVFSGHDIFVQGFWNVRKTSCWGIRAGFIF